MPKASKYGVRKTGGVLGNNSVVSYYGTLRTAINRAYKEFGFRFQYRKQG